MRGANTSTFFGQAWLVLNPCCSPLSTTSSSRSSAARMIQPSSPISLLGIFAFQLVGHSITSGATSVTSSGKLLLNTPFPRLLIPLSAVRTAFFRFLPTVPVYFVFHAIFLTHVWSRKMLLSLYFLATMIVFGMGLAAFFAALQVYFRDTSSFLPFFVRIWMYLSPILWAPEHIIGRFSRTDHDAHPAQPDVFHDRRLHRAVAERRVPASLHVDICGSVGARGCGDRVLVLHLEGA